MSAREPAWACRSRTISWKRTAATSRLKAGPAKGPPFASACLSRKAERDTMAPIKKHSLLVVDDEPDVCDSVHDLLRREFNVLKARSAEEGLKLMRENEVHIIMTDQRMPKVTGVELLKSIRAGHPQAMRMLFIGYA